MITKKQIDELQKKHPLADDINDLLPEISGTCYQSLALAGMLAPMDWNNFAVLTELYDIKYPQEILERLALIWQWENKATVYL